MSAADLPSEPSAASPTPRAARVPATRDVAFAVLDIARSSIVGKFLARAGHLRGLAEAVEAKAEHLDEALGRLEELLDIFLPAPAGEPAGAGAEEAGKVQIRAVEVRRTTIFSVDGDCGRGHVSAESAIRCGLAMRPGATAVDRASSPHARRLPGQPRRSTDRPSHLRSVEDHPRGPELKPGPYAGHPEKPDGDPSGPDAPPT